MTRCKQGDMAVVVRNSTGKECEGMLGTVIRCAEARCTPWGDAWLVRPRICPGCGERVAGLLDADLDPIRPPAQEQGWKASVKEMDDMGRFADARKAVSA